MKKLIVSLLLVASIATVYAQQRDVNRARNIVRSENPNFTLARELITPALQDETTKNLANTWFIAGEIGYREIEDYNNRTRFLNPGALSQARQGQIAIESFNFFLVADSLDQLPDDRGRVRPNARQRREIRRMITDFYQHGSFLGYGAYLFENNDFAGAFDVFNVFLSIPDLPLMENTIEKDTTFYMIMYFAAASASSAEKSHEAIRLFEKLKASDFEEMLVIYQLLYQEYYLINDTVNFVRILKEGMERFPLEPWFLQNLIDYYIMSEQPETALMYLETAIQREPDFAQYRFVEGVLHEQLEDEERAEAAFRKALELDSDLAGALEALGLLHLRRAQAIEDAASGIRDHNLRRQEEEKIDNELRLALPFFERLSELKPEERRYKYRLRHLYNVLRMDSELEAIMREMEQTAN